DPTERDRGPMQGAPLALVRDERQARRERGGRLPPRRDGPPSDPESSGGCSAARSVNSRPPPGFADPSPQPSLTALGIAPGLDRTKFDAHRSSRTTGG